VRREVEAPVPGSEADARPPLVPVQRLPESLRGELAAALAEGALAVHYQPVTDIASHEVVGAEALVRWQHPDVGAVPAPLIVAIAERHGFMPDLGRWVLRQACLDAMSWPNPKLSLSVNVSPTQLCAGDFAALVDDVVDETGFRAERLVCEITETTMFDDVDASSRTARELHELGVKLAVDDFGAGYSSLAYLRHFPVDVLKIDRTFTSGVARDAVDHAIVGGVARLATALGIHTIAEGVETQAQAVALQSLGCRTGQGFYWSPAVPASTFVGLLARPFPRTPTSALREVTTVDSADSGNSPAEHLARALRHEGAALADIAAALGRAGLGRGDRPWTTGQVRRLLGLPTNAR
jgi:EAL domain-containing protein (putative c-di-GMP-specific phosphodiesterase class I)